MERPQSTEFVAKDTPLFSLSAIGSPAAFSTAVKQPGSPTSRAVNNGHSPFTNLGALPREPSPQHIGASVNGRLSLSSTLSDKGGGAQSLNNTCTSMGILDLDAMQDSSMHRFLTSPFDSQDLNLHMSSTMSAPSTQASGRAPVISDLNECNHPTNGVTPYHVSTTLTTEQSLGIPQELLLRQPGSEYSSSSEGTETPDPFASQVSPPPPLGEYSDDEDDNPLAIAEAIKGALDELELTSSSNYSEEGPEYENETSSPPPHTSAVTTCTSTVTATPQHNIATAKSLFSASPLMKENGLPNPPCGTSTTGGPFSSSPIIQPNTASSGIAHTNGHLDRDVRDGDMSLKLEDLSLGTGGEREGETAVRPEGGENVSAAGADETLIGDEVEPSVMREADEFSRFDPSHLSSLLEKESFNSTKLSPVRSNERDAPTSAVSSKLANSARVTPAGSSELASSLPILHTPSSSGVTQQLNDSISGNITSNRMNTSTTVTKSTITVSLPSKRGESGREVSPVRREGLTLEGAAEGDISSRTESALGYSTSEGGSPTHTMEGLPSALLAPTSFLTDIAEQSTMENSALASLTHSPHHTINPLLHVPTITRTGLANASVASITQTSGFTKSLGGGTLSFEAGGFDTPVSAMMNGASGGGVRNSSGVYNPFDSDDNGSVESFGQLEFGDHSSDSFMAQLAKDEEEIKATNLTPGSQQFESFTSVLGTSHFSTSLGDNLSMDSYFQQKSGKMGQLSASKLPPSERPRFSDATGHLIESPDISQPMPTSGHVTSTAPPTTHVLESIPEGDVLDGTLVSENADSGQSLPTHHPTVPGLAGSSSQSSSTSDDLTPIITSHSPFPAKFDLPKLDFANASAISQHTISPISSQPRSTGIRTLPSSSPLLQKSNKSDVLPRTAETSSVGLPSELLKPAVVDDSTTSSLMFKELSALSLSSPPSMLDPSLRSMPTPSIAKLPGFDITAMTNTQHFASFSSSRDVTSSDLGLDHSLLHTLPSPGKSKLLPEHAKNMTSPSKLVAGVAASIVRQGQSSPLKLVENPLSSAQMSSSKFSPKRLPPTTSITSERLQTSPERFQVGVGQVLSTETLTTWSSNSPLTSPPQGQPSPPLKDGSLAAKNTLATTPSKKSVTVAASSVELSPKTEAARRKLANLQAQLDAACFNAEEFLANLNGNDGPPTTIITGKVASATAESSKTSESTQRMREKYTSPSPTKSGRSLKGGNKVEDSVHVSVTKSPPTRTSRSPVSSTTPSPKSKTSPSSSHSGGKRSFLTSIPRPSKPFMAMPSNSSASKKTAPAHSPEKRKRDSGQDQAVLKASGKESDQLLKHSPLRKKVQGTPTKREPGQRMATIKDGSKASPNSEAKRLSSKVVKSSHNIQSEAGSGMKRHVHIQEPQSSKMLVSSGERLPVDVTSSSGENPLKLSMMGTLSSTKFELSSLVTSHAHTSTSSPPPLSTLTMSTSPSSQGHTPPSTASSTASPLSTPQPPTTISTASQLPTLHSASSNTTSHTSQPYQPHLITKPLTKGPTPHSVKLPTTTDPTVLKVPDSLCFDQVCCVGVSISDQFTVANLGERWLQLEFRLVHLYRDGTECSVSDSVFSLPQRSFVGPEQQEPVKVTFSPLSGGSYEAVVAVYAHLVVSSSMESNKPVANVILKGIAEEPQIEIQTTSSGPGDDVHGRSLSPPVLDYGVMVGGNTTNQQLRLANRGLAPLPLCLSITAKSALSQLYFNFGEVPQSLVSVLHPSLLGSSHLPHPYHHTLMLTLPPRPEKGHGDPEWYNIDVCFHAPKRYIDDSITDPGPPEEISAQLLLSVNGLSPTPGHCMASVPLQAIVGLARLHVPKTLQCVSLSCTAGRATTREVPFKNAGNIPLRVRLKVSGDHDQLFNISPDFLLMEPRQESQVNVYFSSSSPVVCDGALLIHIEPNGPNYELKLQGTATPTATPTVVATTAMTVEEVGSESTRPGEEGILSCNKRVLYWGGVKLSKSICQEVVLHNGHSVGIPLSLSIRHPDSPFKLKSVGDEGTSHLLSQQTSERKVELLPGMQLPVGVVYTPTAAAVCLSALDITDLLHSKKYRIRLCGYGGSSQVEVVSGHRVSGECWLDLGEITRGKKISTKISIYNSGPRDAFVVATCHPDAKSTTPLPVDRVSVMPSKLIIPPQQIKDVQLVYHTNERDEAHCSSYPALLACLKLTTGDEILRQRLQKVVTQRLLSSLDSQHQEGEGGAPSSRMKNASNEVFLAHFPEQEAVPTEPDFSGFELEDEEDVFEQHLTTLTVSLSGSPPPTSLKNKTATVFTVSPPPRTATARLKHKLSLSNTPPVQVGVAKTSSKQGFTQTILTAYTVVLPDTHIGHYSEKYLDIHNPYSSDLEWELSHNASPFVRKLGGGSGGKRSHQEKGLGGEIFKANYSVFWVSERRGITPPQSTSKVPVLFQPHDVGSFSQIWDLKVCCDEAGTKKLRVSFGGRATANPSTDQPQSREMAPKSHDQQPRSHDQQSKSQDRTEQITKWLSQTQRHRTAEPAVVSSTTSATPLRKAVYIKDERVVFPATKVGSKSTIKVRVCNRGLQRYQFDVIKLVPPFSVDHHNFELGSRQCARLPIHFSPTSRGEYVGVLAIRTNAGHQAFTELRGKSLS